MEFRVHSRGGCRDHQCCRQQEILVIILLLFGKISQMTSVCGLEMLLLEAINSCFSKADLVVAWNAGVSFRCTSLLGPSAFSILCRMLDPVLFLLLLMRVERLDCILVSCTFLARQLLN